MSLLCKRGVVFLQLILEYYSSSLNVRGCVGHRVALFTHSDRMIQGGQILFEQGILSSFEQGILWSSGWTSCSSTVHTIVDGIGCECSSTFVSVRKMAQVFAAAGTAINCQCASFGILRKWPSVVLLNWQQTWICYLINCD